VGLLLRIVAVIVAMDAIAVGGLWVSSSVATYRTRREVQELERLWSISSRTPVLRGRRSPARRLAAVVVAGTIVFFGTAVASQQAPQVGTAAEPASADVVATATGRGANAPSAPKGPASDVLTRASAGVLGGDIPRTDTPPPAASSSGTGPASDAPSRPIQGPPTVLGVPSSMTVIEVAWSDVAGEDGYRVERSRDADAGWVEVATTPAGVTTYADDGLSPGTTYFYRVFATTTEGDSPPSDVVSATTADAPGIPTGVVAVSGAPQQIDLSWADVDGETGYRLERSPDGVSGWTPIATTGQDVTTYSDTGLSPKTTYFYRIVAVGPYGDGTASDVVQATTSAHPLHESDGKDHAPDVTD
jgi:hypothetical protein